MQCPYCNHTFPLTWRRYFTEPTAAHKCPACNKQSRLPRTTSYLILLVVGQCILGIPCGLLFWHLWGIFWIAPGWAVGALLGGLPFDKYVLDEKYRKLEKVDAD